MSIRIFSTTVEKQDGLYEGPQIFAISWKNARELAKKMGVVLDGELFATSR